MFYVMFFNEKIELVFAVFFIKEKYKLVKNEVVTFKMLTMRFSTIFQPVMGRVKAKLIQYGLHLIQLTQEEATGSNDCKFLLNMKKKKRVSWMTFTLYPLRAKHK